MLSSALGGTETSGAAGALGALWPVGRAALAALGIGIVMVVMALLPSGLGFGDVKLSALCALWLGQLSAEAPIMGIILGFFTGGLAALVLMALHRADRKTASPRPLPGSGSLADMAARRLTTGRLLHQRVAQDVCCTPRCDLRQTEPRNHAKTMYVP